MNPASGAPAVRSLRRRWLAIALVYAAALAAGSRSLAGAWDASHAWRWTAWAGLALAYLLAALWFKLPDNRRHGRTAVLPTLGAGTALSLARGLCLGLLAGFLLSPRPPGVLAWAPAVLYTAADLMDYFDGYLARITDHATVLGEALDLDLDALGLLLAVVLAVGYGALPAWFMPFGLARYAFVLGLWALRRLGRPTYDLPLSRARRPIAGLTMGFLSAVLWPIFTPPLTVLAGMLFALPFAVSFGRDWLVVSGALDPRSEGYARARRLAREALAGWLPLPLRVLTAASAGAMLAGEGGATALAAVLAGIVALAAILILVGAAGRAASFALIAAVATTVAAAGLSPARALTLVGAIGVLILGTGKASLWRPEDEMFGRRAGAPPGDGSSS